MSPKYLSYFLSIQLMFLQFADKIPSLNFAGKIFSRGGGVISRPLVMALNGKDSIPMNYFREKV